MVDFSEILEKAPDWKAYYTIDELHESSARLANEYPDQVKLMVLGKSAQGEDIDCLKIGDTWVHLRYCVACGYVGCCDNSKNRHARAHWNDTGHGVIRSKEPNEYWAYCYPDDEIVSTSS